MVSGILRTGVGPSIIARRLESGVKSVDTSLTIGVYDRVPLEHAPRADSPARYRLYPRTPESTQGGVDIGFLARRLAVEPSNDIALLVPPADYRTVAGLPLPMPVPLAVYLSGRTLVLEHAEPRFAGIGGAAVASLCDQSHGQRRLGEAARA